LYLMEWLPSKQELKWEDSQSDQNNIALGRQRNRLPIRHQSHLNVCEWVKM
jgi:hypothetical protein